MTPLHVPPFFRPPSGVQAYDSAVCPDMLCGSVMMGEALMFLEEGMLWLSKSIQRLSMGMSVYMYARLKLLRLGETFRAQLLKPISTTLSPKHAAYVEPHSESILAPLQWRSGEIYRGSDQGLSGPLILREQDLRCWFGSGNNKSARKLGRECGWPGVRPPISGERYAPIAGGLEGTPQASN